MEASLSPTTPTSENWAGSPQPAPKPPRSLSLVPEGQDDAEEREDTWWHRQYLEERGREVEAQDTWENWVWSAKGRWGWVNPLGDSREDNNFEDGTRKKRVRGGLKRDFFTNKYGSRS